MAKIVYGLVLGQKVFQVKAKLDEKHSGAPEGTWVCDGRIMIPGIQFFYKAKVYKSSL